MSGSELSKSFSLEGRVVVITGGAGFLGEKHAEAIVEARGIPVIADVNGAMAKDVAARVEAAYGGRAFPLQVDITAEGSVRSMVTKTMEAFGRIDVLINNAQVSAKDLGTRRPEYFASFEEYPLDLWEMALRVNMTGAFLCCREVGKEMVRQRRGVIINIASDVGIISPNHSIYIRDSGEPFGFNTPISYAATKAALISMTRYLATYFAPYGIRANSLSPAGVFNNHHPEFVAKLASLIPMGRMANRDEYKAAIVFLASDASSFMTGANLVIDGGRTCW